MAKTTPVVYRGNCPGNVSRDAKYSVRRQGEEMVVGVLYRAPDGELWYPTTDTHRELVEMVNDIKRVINEAPGGAFYINEHHQVLVPAGPEGQYYCAGEYLRPLVFRFEGKLLSGDGVNFEGEPLQPGDCWVGLHPGIPYVLAAGGKDIYYRYDVRPRVKKEVRLSVVRSPEIARKYAETVRCVKGWEGGRFYVNEFLCVFAPIQTESVLEYIYIGRIESLDEWFPRSEGKP